MASVRYHFANREKVMAKRKAYYEKNKERLKLTPDKKKDYKLKSDHGISLSAYQSMVDGQRNKCKICGKNQSEIKENLQVDHCHSSGKIRGLLCGKCNRGIGLLGDNASSLLKAYIYLMASRDNASIKEQEVEKNNNQIDLFKGQ